MAQTDEETVDKVLSKCTVYPTRGRDEIRETIEKVSEVAKRAEKEDFNGETLEKVATAIDLKSRIEEEKEWIVFNGRTNLDRFR